MTRHALLIAAGTLVASGASALAQHAGDIALYIQDSRIRTGAFDAGGSIVTGVCIFGSELGDVVENFTDEPGFDSAPGTFDPDSALGFRIRGALRVWDGSDFDEIPEERVEITFGPFGPVSTPATDVIVEGFTVNVGSNGQWHRHLGYTLTSPAAPGVYLLELDLFSTDAGLQTSNPFWLVFAQDVPEADHDAAIDWVAATRGCGACPADFDGNGTVNTLDFLAFLNAFNAGDPRADFDANGVINTLDFLAFLNAFNLGC